MRNLYQVLFGVIVGMAAAGIVSLIDLSPAMMFGVGMLYGSLAQLLAQRLLTGRPGNAEATAPERPELPVVRQAIEPPTLTESTVR